MIRPIITANQVIANKTTLPFRAKDNEDGSLAPVSVPAEKAYTDRSVCGEKLDVNCTGCREYTLNGQKMNFFA